tara:strand:- start:58 stop:447 length:390 start_codon:yes stop_codon:yes gene_type:complete
MALIQYLAVFLSALIGFYLGSLILPKYDAIIYPFVPGFSLFFQFYKILLPLGICSMSVALVSSWVYKKAFSFAAFSSIVAALIDYRFKLFTNLSEHYFHFSYLIVYAFGVYLSYWLVKYYLARFGAKNT